MPPHDHSAREVGSGDQDRVDLEFHPVDRVTCKVGGRARPPREELRFECPLALTPVPIGHAPGDLFTNSVSEEMGECGEGRFIAGVRDERFMLIPVPNDRPIEDRDALFTTDESRTRDVQREDQPRGDRACTTAEVRHWCAGEDFWTHRLVDTLAGDAEQEGDDSQGTGMAYSTSCHSSSAPSGPNAGSGATVRAKANCRGPCGRFHRLILSNDVVAQRETPSVTPSPQGTTPLPRATLIDQKSVV